MPWTPTLDLDPDPTAAAALTSFARLSTSDRSRRLDQTKDAKRPHQEHPATVDFAGHAVRPCLAAMAAMAAMAAIDCSIPRRLPSSALRCLSSHAASLFGCVSRLSVRQASKRLLCCSAAHAASRGAPSDCSLRPRQATLCTSASALPPPPSPPDVPPSLPPLDPHPRRIHGGASPGQKGGAHSLERRATPAITPASITPATRRALGPSAASPLRVDPTLSDLDGRAKHWRPTPKATRRRPPHALLPLLLLRRRTHPRLGIENNRPNFLVRRFWPPANRAIRHPSRRQPHSRDQRSTATSLTHL